MQVTGIIIIIDTFQNIPKEFSFPKIPSEDFLQQAIGDIIAIMNNPLKTPTLLSYGDAKKFDQSYFPHIAKKHISTVLTDFTVTTNATTNSE